MRGPRARPQPCTSPCRPLLNRLGAGALHCRATRCAIFRLASAGISYYVCHAELPDLPRCCPQPSQREGCWHPRIGQGGVPCALASAWPLWPGDGAAQRGGCLGAPGSPTGHSLRLPRATRIRSAVRGQDAQRPALARPAAVVWEPRQGREGESEPGCLGADRAAPAWRRGPALTAATPDEAKLLTPSSSSSSGLQLIFWG